MRIETILNKVDRHKSFIYRTATFEQVEAEGGLGCGYCSTQERAGEGCDEEVLKHTKYCFLKNEKNLTVKQKIKLTDVLQYDQKSVRAYLLKESFQLFWNYNGPYWAEWYLNKWCTRAMRSRLEPIKGSVPPSREYPRSPGEDRFRD